MATWKKVIVSGSNADLNQLRVKTSVSASQFSGSFRGNGLLVTNLNYNNIYNKPTLISGSTQVLASGPTLSIQFNDSTARSGSSNFTFSKTTNKVSLTGSLAINGSLYGRSTVIATKLTGSFSGSFKGDGSGLTGLPAGAVTSYTNGSNNRVLTSTDASGINGETNLTFDGSLLSITGTVNATSTISGSAIKLSALPTKVDNTVLIIDSAGNVGTDEIDSRVWGSTLVDGSGANTRIAFWSDADSITSDTDFTYNSTSNILTISGSTFGQNVYIAGNLTVMGDVANQNVTNLSVEDKFILLNSGSATGDGGIIIQTESNFSGAALGWDDSATRWSLQVNSKLSSTATTISPDAYIAAVIDVDNGMSDIAAHQLNGNIKIQSGEIYIYS